MLLNLILDPSGGSLVLSFYDFLAAPLYTKLVDGVGVGYYGALFAQSAFNLLMLALRPFFALLEMENATHGMEDSLPVLVLLRRIEMALYATLSGVLIQPEVKC
ncbi:hypothetical protein Nepgr_006699 [Nepenthes gracilis]|uniref:Uncharacterized protein n=1 Tax=Nepenthes gracilis TaxID=150966 RepID=A0AAD3XHL5_NEPGR|nr:hypothetical protein Nepgr_006699 [Nepenthes gracilis]